MDSPAPLPERAVAVVVHDGHLLVVRRARAGRAPYAVLPGGGEEPGETPGAGCLRELTEETGLSGRVVSWLATLDHADRRAHYFRVEVDQPTAPLRLGGPERETQSTGNVHRPAWIPLIGLGPENLQPPGAAELVRRCLDQEA